MAKVKNSFMRSRMNKDLDDRLLPNGEYRDALNVSINKSQGDGTSEGNVGTIQTVLGNTLIADFQSLATPNLPDGVEVIGVLPSDSTNSIYAFITNNILDPYVPPGSIGLNTTYPASQDTSTGGPISLTTPGTGYATTPADGTTTGGTGTGLTVSVNLIGEALASVEIMSFGSGYSLGDVITIDGGNDDATITVVSLLPSYSAIVSFNVVTNSSFKIIVEGSWLNFSTQAPVYAINLLEDLLFFTDNRNQPRKVNINQSPTYYTTEDQISVAKYYPYESIELYQPSPIAGSILTEITNNAVSDSKTITIASIVSGTQPDKLGVTGIAVDISAGGSGYSVTGSTLATAGGSGIGLTVSVTAVVGGAITGIDIVSQGQGYNSGDTVVVTSGNNDAELSISAVLANTFVTDASNWPTSVLVNQAQTLPAGMTINFVSPETTMQDGDDLYLPTTATAQVVGTPTPTTTSFSVKEKSYKGFFGPAMIGHSIYLFTPGSLVPYVNTGSKITSMVTGTGFNIDIACSPPLTLAFSDTNKVLFAIPNPYYDSTFARNANADFLKDKFVRFSYRFRFDDGEYSLIAPFTQPCFIPQQDGYFLNINSGTKGTEDVNETVNQISDEEAAYRSTEVAFMENKVNKILLNVPLPSTAGSLGDSFKVTELEILYKESDQLAIKVVESIPLQNNISGNNNYYQYEYGSKPPFQTLPSKETTRVFDKVPVRALSQEVISNRIVYGNYQDKHTPPAFLDYNLGATPKEDFIISKNEVNSFTSSVEYPNATLKQNRNFEVGVVLADKFGRQSTIIFSKQSQFAALNQFLASSIFSPYRGDDESEPIAGIQEFDGNSLKIEFNNFIQSDRNVNSGTPGLYNGDITSADYNPLGWYSFKIVVKQIEQEYYNAYIPAAMACYPFADEREKELDQTSHVVLYNDNINKIPRDLTEVGPAQRDFRSSVRMFGRVASLGSVNLNTAFFPEKIADITSNVATIKDLFDYENFPALTAPPTPTFLFYNFNYLSTGSGATSSFPDSSSLVARVSTQKKFGVQVGTSGLYGGTPALNVYEIEPTVSLLDIYYETSTSGTIDQLNKAIDEGADSAFAFIDGPTKWTLTEGATDLQDDFCGNFQPVRLDGNSFPNPIDNICTLVSVVDGYGNPTDPISGVPYFNPADVTLGIFNIAPGSIPGTFKIVLSKTPSGSDTPGLVFKTLSNNNILPNNFIFTFECEHPDTGNVVSTLSFQRALINVLPPTPIVLSNTDFPVPGNPGVSLCQKLQTDPTLQVVVSLQPTPNSFVPGSTLATVQGDNGSSTVDLDEQDLSFDIRSMSIRSAPGVTPVSYSPISENQWDNHWRLENSTTANINRHLIAGDDFEAGRAYLVEIAAVDASGFYGQSCYASFIIESIVSAELGNSGTPALLSPCPNSTALGSIVSESIDSTNAESGETTNFSTTLQVNNGDAKVTFTLSMESNVPVFGDFEAECVLDFPLGNDTSGNPVAFTTTINGPIATTTGDVQFNLPAGFSASTINSRLFIKSAGGTLVGIQTANAKLSVAACKLV